MVYLLTVKILKSGTPKITLTVLKRVVWFYSGVMRPKDADGMANSADP